MKIGVIGHKRVPSREGGIEKTIEKQMLRMRDRGHEVVFYNRSGHNIFGSEFEEPDRNGLFHDTEIETVFTPKGSLGVPIYSFLATIKALRAKCDVIYYHGSGSCLMIPVAKCFGAGCAAMLHGIDSKRAKWGRLGKFYLEKGEKAAAKKADVCLVLSRNMKKYIKERYDKDAVLTFNGAERPEEYGSAMRPEKYGGTGKPVDKKAAFADLDSGLKERFGVGKDDYILTLVRIVPEKGIHYLIKAFRQIKTDKKLVIAGGADPACIGYYRELKALAAGDDRIIFTGYVLDPEVTALYKGSYAYVLPSDLEGMAHSLLEAMAAGCCCVVSDIPENAEVVEDHAITFRHGDFGDLKEKLEMLLEEPEKAAGFRKKAADFILEKYDWDKCVDCIENIFEAIEKRNG